MTAQKKYPIPTQEQEDIEEALGVIWHKFEDGVLDKKSILPVIEEGVHKDIYQNLLAKGFAIEQGDTIRLSPQG